jgi:N-carbamoylputrescine amidase
VPLQPDELPRAWARLCEHSLLQRSEVVLLPEFAFVDPLWKSAHFDEQRWSLASSACQAWIRRLDELAVEYVVGTRPVTRKGRHFNEGFLWSRSGMFTPLRRKFFMPDEPDAWEGRWFDRGDAYFPRYRAGALAFGLNICTELWALETYAEYSAMNLHAVMCPRATAGTTLQKWLCAGTVAAVRSGAYCISSNRVHPDGSAGGAGWVIGPDGGLLCQTSRDAPFATVDVDLRAAEAAQSTYPRDVLADVRAPSSWIRRNVRGP